MGEAMPWSFSPASGGPAGRDNPRRAMGSRVARGSDRLRGRASPRVMPVGAISVQLFSAGFGCLHDAIAQAAAAAGFDIRVGCLRFKCLQTTGLVGDVGGTVVRVATEGGDGCGQTNVGEGRKYSERFCLISPQRW
ncbi:unnamed protein product [Scytosiphon promiscuus]